VSLPQTDRRPPLVVTDNVAQMRGIVWQAQRRGARFGLVPTMGALHAGHLSLIDAARQAADCVVMSVFVNPLQFAPGEDFERYPRDLERDRTLARDHGVDVLFTPTVAEMYDAGAQFRVHCADIGTRLEGGVRPGHFDGVLTVVAKLFNIVEPDLAFFGQKDAAQVAVIKRMVRDLNFPVAVEVCPIVRESDGLALSSRNTYLSPDERKMALVLHASLQRAQKLFSDGDREAAKVAAEAQKAFVWQPAVRLDYFEIVDPDDLLPITTINQRSLVAVAAFIGNTRLIDNILLEP